MAPAIARSEYPATRLRDFRTRTEAWRSFSLLAWSVSNIPIPCPGHDDRRAAPFSLNRESLDDGSLRPGATRSASGWVTDMALLVSHKWTARGQLEIDTAWRHQVASIFMEDRPNRKDNPQHLGGTARHDTTTTRQNSGGRHYISVVFARVAHSHTHSRVRTGFVKDGYRNRHCGYERLQARSHSRAPELLRKHSQEVPAACPGPSRS